MGVEFYYSVDVMEEGLETCVGGDLNSSPFISYMKTGSLQLQIWDKDGKIYIGSAFIPLAHILRQGQSGIVYDYDAEIIVHDVSCIFRYIVEY